RGEVLATRIDEDVRLPWADLEVDAVEAERKEGIEDSRAARGIPPGPVIAVELRDEPRVVDVDGKTGERVSVFVDEAEGGGRGGASEAPAPLERTVERSPQRPVVVVHRFPEVPLTQPLVELGGRPGDEAHRLARRRVLERERTRMKEKPRRLRSAI